MRDSNLSSINRDDRKAFAGAAALRRACRAISAPVATVMLCLALSCGASRADDAPKPLSQQACEDQAAFWSLWIGLYPERQHPSRPIFPLSEVLTALHDVPMPPPDPSRPDPNLRPDGRYAEDMEYYRPADTYNAQGTYWIQTGEYARAASAYEAGQFRHAVKLFDGIVKNHPPSQIPFAMAPLYRAAAAYTAARAQFDLGNSQDGARRIAGILSDSTLSEFWPQSWNLLAHMRAETDSAPFAAAEALQIGRLLVTPDTVLCSGIQGFGTSFNGSVILGEEDFTLVDSVSINDSMFEVRLGAMPFPCQDDCRAGLDYAGRKDPVVAAALTLGVSADEDRRRWNATRNPLFAVALGKHGDRRDLAALLDAIGAVRSWHRGTAFWSDGTAHDCALTLRAQATLITVLSAERARIYLNLGEQAQALDALNALTRLERAAIDKDPPQIVRDTRDWIISGAVHNLLVAYRRPEARLWALAASPALAWPLKDYLKPFLAADFDELYRNPVLRLTPVDGEIRLGNLRWLFDRWSSSRLIAFSRRYDVSDSDRRALVGAAWIRAFALQHWGDVYAWLPDLKSAYPILEPDIDAIGTAWLPSSRHRLALRLVMHAPGLVALPSWSRATDGPHRWWIPEDAIHPTDVRAFDPWNPSDGNWWCAPQTTDRYSFFEIDHDISAAPGDRLFASVSPLARTGDGGELAELNALGSSNARFATDALAWLRADSWLERWTGLDRYIPEVLHDVVQATRQGCRRPEDNSAWSRAAYAALHRYYPHSRWTTQTPYWFGVIR
jgi:hypothetical protein